MGRREAPVRTTNQALAALAMWLRTVRAHAGLTYQLLAREVGFHPTTLQRAASGTRMPSREVVLAYAVGCGAREDHAEQLWKEARYEARRSVRDRQTSLAAPRPELVRDFADLGAVLVELYDKAGAPPLRQMEQRAGQFGLLPRSTAHRIVNKQAIPHSHAQFEAFLRACDVGETEQKPWLEAWKRAWREHTGAGQDDPDRARFEPPPTPHSTRHFRVPSTGMLRTLAEAGYELLSWHTNTPTTWRVRCIGCLRQVTFQVEVGVPPRECRCRRTAHEPIPSTRRPPATEEPIDINRATEHRHPLAQALQHLELSRSRLRAPLLDQAEELRAAEELRTALRHVYIAMAEHGRIESGLRNIAQSLLNRSTDLLAWIEAESDSSTPWEDSQPARTRH